MKLYGFTAPFAVLTMLLLASCGQEKTKDAPQAVVANVVAPPDVPVMGPELRVLAFGDSLFAGYGVKSSESYPAKLEAALRARGVNARIANAGVSGDTTAGGLERLDFTLSSQSQPPQLAIISLGGNDMLRGLPVEQTRANLEKIVGQLRSRGIKVVLMGLLAPPNLGQDYRGKFDAIYPALAAKHGAALVPFFLQPVMDKPDLLQADRIHPNALGIEEMVAATVGEVAKAAE